MLVPCDFASGISAIVHYCKMHTYVTTILMGIIMLIRIIIRQKGFSWSNEQNEMELTDERSKEVEREKNGLTLLHYKIVSASLNLLCMYVHFNE